MMKKKGIRILVFLLPILLSSMGVSFAQMPEEAVTEPAISAPDEGLPPLGEASEGGELLPPVDAPEGAEEVGSPPVGGPLEQLPRISLELKGMDILDVLKLLAKKSGLNIAAGANVRGRVTIFLKDVDVWDALRIILESNNLAYERDGEIIKVMTARDYEMLYGKRFHEKTRVKIIQLEHARAADLTKALNQVKTKVGKLVVDERSNIIVLIDIPAKIKEMEALIQKMDILAVTKVFSLNYAKATDIEAKISEIVTRDVGKVRIDERTNKIIVTDIPKNVETIERIIAAFDEKTLQVLIEAEIIEVILYDDFAYGINWEYVLSGDVAITKSLNISIPGTTASIVGTIAPEEISGTVQLLQKFGKTNTLSAPRIAVANNEEAKILVGKKDVYITATISTTDGTTTSAPSVNYVDIGLVLSVTPTINRAGFVTMKIKPEVTDFEKYETLEDAEGRQIAKVPVITTTEAETTVMVKDGSTILIGGLIKDKEVTATDKVPLLGDIPLLNMLFKSKSREIDKTELVIFLTPRIISGNISSPEAEEKLGGQQKGPQAEEEKAIAPRGSEEEKAIAPQGSEEEKAIVSKGSFRKEETIVEGSSKPLPSKAKMTLSRYRQILWDRISQSLRANCPQRAGSGKVCLSFVVSANGHLKGAPQVLSGNNQFLEAIAIKSVKDATPFPPFTGSLNKAQERFIIPITFD